MKNVKTEIAIAMIKGVWWMISTPVKWLWRLLFTKR
jgi:hypothetical protein